MPAAAEPVEKKRWWLAYGDFPGFQEALGNLLHSVPGCRFGMLMLDIASAPHELSQIKVVQPMRLVDWHVFMTGHANTQVNLKRKHWGASGAEQPAGQRCRGAFQRQMAPAAAAGPSGGQGGYRIKGAQQSGAQQGASQAPAKGRSCPAVKVAGEGPTARGPGAGAARGRQGRGFKVRLHAYLQTCPPLSLGSSYYVVVASLVPICALPIISQN